MNKYCKILDNKTGLVQLGIGCSDEYYIEIGMEIRDVQQSDINNQWYLIDKCPMKTEEQKLIEAKQNKLQDNNVIRDGVLNSGVEYKDILFDSDTDQKVNLLATIGFMSDEDTVNWFGKDNQMLECNKQDLINIGNLIIQLHSYCWAKNAEIVSQINSATTIEELSNIQIDYSMEEV